jgi:hypothetical protein
VGSESRSAVSRRSACPVNSGANNCTQWSRLVRRVETRDVVDALRRKDCNPLTATCGLLHARTDGLQPGELSPGHLVGAHLRRAGAIQIAMCRRVTDVRDIAVDEGYQCDPRRQCDVALRIQAVFDL